MADRKPFLLRLEPGVHLALQRWADDELRSLNGQIEYLLRDALRRAGRQPQGKAAAGAPPPARKDD
ncbi:MAG TPA: hypothetical protein VGV61_06445 [Thermoanaerobaculia bacterium]|jgi:hypothetical protein|nr:hypothetical protein [Thermoanaerobaculia bacterium]